MERILSFSQQLDLLPKDGLILCALSGGRDSVALLHFLQTHGYAVAAAHFDHRLRPNSAADADFCEKLCGQWDIPFFRGAGDVGSLPGNTEANARDARYAFLTQTAQACGAKAIATAHNADDNLETVLLHLTRGCGLNGLTGIQPRRGILIRPMLKTPRAAIDAYVQQQRLPFVEDETNADTQYSRNRIRHQVLPVLKSINPKVVEVAGDMADHLRADQDFLADHGRPTRNLPQTYPKPTPNLPFTPPVPTTDLPLEGRFDTFLWTLTTCLATAPGDLPPTRDGFFLRVPPALRLRSRRPGDRIHPPFRTGKTLKKWFNELKVPENRRDATPVLTDGEHILSVAGIGPNEVFLARPGEKSLHVQWTKIERREQNEAG